MRAVICSRFEGPSALTIGDMPSPSLGKGQIRIAVKAASLNFADILVVEGRYQVKPPLPFVPGLEAAGIVTEVADDVTAFSIGQPVMAALGMGAFAEDVVVSATAAFPVPVGMGLTTAAAFPIVYGTAHTALCRRANLQRGETLVVFGAAGGAGLAAVEVGKALGARVIAAVSGREKAVIAETHGADHVFDYSSEDVRERIKDLTNGKGADVFFDPVGGDVFDAALRAIAWEGRIVIIGFAGGRIPQVPANILLVKNVSAIGMFWAGYRSHTPAYVQDCFRELEAWYRQGLLKPRVSTVVPAAQVGDAMTALRGRRSTGKVVLTF